MPRQLRYRAKTLDPLGRNEHVAAVGPFRGASWWVSFYSLLANQLSVGLG